MNEEPCTSSSCTKCKFNSIHFLPTISRKVEKKLMFEFEEKKSKKVRGFQKLLD